uniref:F-box domain-containing protein n=1 Tax=Oryza nivara TaxID=4536 RepID=A0A0E0G919_ORYNI
MDADEMALARLPDEVIQDILARLPLRTIVRCLAVCKAWRSAVSAPTFHRALAAHRPAAVVKVTSELAYFGKPWRYCKALLLDTFRGGWFGPDLDNTQPERREREFVLWNPLTGACATVPPPAPGGDRGVIIGAYAHPATMRFHLLHAAGEAERGLFAATAIRVRRVGDGGAWRERGSGSTARLNVLVFDTARERFRLMEAPPWDDSRGGGEKKGLAMSRVVVLSGVGKLCAVAVSPATNTMEMWVLDDDDSSGGARAWRLAERVGLVMMWDKRDLSRAFSSATQVSAVQGDAEGEEVILHNDGQHRRV